MHLEEKSKEKEQFSDAFPNGQEKNRGKDTNFMQADAFFCFFAGKSVCFGEYTKQMEQMRRRWKWLFWIK